MATTTRVIWLCACVRYWLGRGLVYVCPLCCRINIRLNFILENEASQANFSTKQKNIDLAAISALGL